MKKIYIAVVDPAPVVLSGITAILEHSPEVEVVASFAMLDELQQWLRTGRADVIVIAASLVSSIDTITEIGSTPIVGLQSGLMAEETLKRFAAVVTIYTPAEELLRMVTAVVDSPAEHNYAESHELSERECDVLVLVARGMTNKEIASELNISPHTVISHRKNIAHKTGIRSAAGLAVYAVLNKLIDSDKL